MVRQVGEDGSISEIAFDPFNHSTSMDLSQRLMHRYPGDTFTQNNWVWMRFLPPAHLCPYCCQKQKWRQKVVLGRNPFTRVASLFAFAWLPTDRHPGEVEKKNPLYSATKNIDVESILKKAALEGKDNLTEQEQEA